MVRPFREDPMLDCLEAAVDDASEESASGLDLPVPGRFLSDLQVQGEARVVAVRGDRSFRRRLMELGLLPGTKVRVRNVAPLGDPLELELRGCRLSIRRAEARDIEIEK